MFDRFVLIEPFLIDLFCRNILIEFQQVKTLAFVLYLGLPFKVPSVGFLVSCAGYRSFLKMWCYQGG